MIASRDDPHQTWKDGGVAQTLGPWKGEAVPVLDSVDLPGRVALVTGPGVVHHSSDASSVVTGHVLVVDGGHTLW